MRVGGGGFDAVGGAGEEVPPEGVGEELEEGEDAGGAGGGGGAVEEEGEETEAEGVACFVESGGVAAEGQLSIRQ